MTRNPRLPVDRTPDTKPARDRVGGGLDTLALAPRPLTPEARAEERDLVDLAIGRVRVVGDPEETFFVRQLLRSMLLGEP